MSGSIVPSKQKVQGMRELLERSKGQIALALPKHLTPERMMRVALTAIQTSPQLLDCDPRSVIGAVVQAAQLGLEVGVMGQAYLVPYKQTAQLIVGYRGLLALARRSGELASFEARVVRRGDVFEFEYGTEARLRHKPSLDADGPVVAFYASARLKSGEHVYEVMTKAQVDAIKSRSRASGNGPWVTDYDEMGRKTVARRLLKWLPVSIELQGSSVPVAAAIDETEDQGWVDDEKAEEPKGLGAVTEKLRAVPAIEAPADCAHPGIRPSAVDALPYGRSLACTDCGEEFPSPAPAPVEREVGSEGPEDAWTQAQVEEKSASAEDAKAAVARLAQKAGQKR